MTDAPLEDELQHIQRLIADAFGPLSDASRRSVGMETDNHPSMRLWQTHEELLEANKGIVRAIDRIENVHGRFEEPYRGPMAKEIAGDHSTRLKERYDGPALMLAQMLLEKNRREWLHRKPETGGAQQVERHGLTENQRAALDSLQAAWDQTDIEMREVQADA